MEATRRLSERYDKMTQRNLLLDASMFSVHTSKTKEVNSYKAAHRALPEGSKPPLETGLTKSLKSINESLKSLDARKTMATTSSKSPKRSYPNRRSNRPQTRLNSKVSSTNECRPISPPRKSTSPFESADSGSSQRYSGVSLSGAEGSLVLSDEQLTFKPRDSRHKDRVLVWHLDVLQKHQISDPNTGPCALKLVSQSHPKFATLTFPDQSSLENINTQLSNKLQPLRKYRKLKETLLTTQRKLKEAYRDIDELQDANEKLLVSCETFAKKCKSFRDELHAQQNDGVHFISNDKVAELEQKLQTLTPEVEALRNERTAMEIGHEMDIETYQSKIASLEMELAEEREALDTERETVQQLLEERETMDEMQSEVRSLAKELSNERSLVKELRSKLERQEKESEALKREVTQQRNKAYQEVEYVRNERNNLQRQLDDCEAWQDYERADQPQDAEVDEVEDRDQEVAKDTRRCHSDLTRGGSSINLRVGQVRGGGDRCGRNGWHCPRLVHHNAFVFSPSLRLVSSQHPFAATRRDAAYPSIRPCRLYPRTDESSQVPLFDGSWVRPFSKYWVDIAYAPNSLAGTSVEPLNGGYDVPLKWPSSPASSVGHLTTSVMMNGTLEDVLKGSAAQWKHRVVPSETAGLLASVCRHPAIHSVDRLVLCEQQQQSQTCSWLLPDRTPVGTTQQEQCRPLAKILSDPLILTWGQDPLTLISSDLSPALVPVTSSPNVCFTQLLGR